MDIRRALADDFSELTELFYIEKLRDAVSKFRLERFLDDMSESERRYTSCPSYHPVCLDVTKSNKKETDALLEALLSDLDKVSLNNSNVNREYVQEILKKSATSSHEEMGQLLLELLGYEHFDLVSRLLQHQSELIGSLRKSPSFSTLGKLGLESNSYPHIYGIPAQTASKMALPDNTERINAFRYEEFILPPPEYKDESNRKNIKMINYEQLSHDSILKAAFSSYKDGGLNRMQSACFPVVYETSENMLVCAPTGAGKTDVALLAILKCFKDYSQTQLQDIDVRCYKKRDSPFKIIYVAPMKALATEIVAKFSKRLKPFSLKVKECTGDTQLTAGDISRTDILVTTPEKWDVMTRKSTGDVDLVNAVRLLILDEVHLLHDDRGAVLESLVARTLRQVEQSQLRIRLIGLSATLPNFRDVAQFLRVDPHIGLFYFDSTFRPIPLTQHFIGVKAGKSSSALRIEQDVVCYQKLQSIIQQGRQVMIFVHSRGDTVRTARTMLRFLAEDNLSLISGLDDKALNSGRDVDIRRCRNGELKELITQRIGVHHAGLLKSDRHLMERLFLENRLQVLVCTATLAWGINLPAYAVIIKGTLVYDHNKGDFANLGILDVLQIFGRAGRPQFEDHGEGFLITSHDQLTLYLQAISGSVPIESKFLSHLCDNLNAEIVLGTVSNISEALRWLEYTFLYVRMAKNPLRYGISGEDARRIDFSLDVYLRKSLELACEQLQNCGMISYHQPTGIVKSKPLGRIASHYYLKYETMELVSKLLHKRMTEEDLLTLLAQSAEFDSLKVRPEDGSELEVIKERYAPMTLKGPMSGLGEKINLLVQAYISRYPTDNSVLGNDMTYVSQNGGRILRAFLEFAVGLKWGELARRALNLGKCFEQRRWMMEPALWQFQLKDQEQLPLNKFNVHDYPIMSFNEVHALVRSKPWAQELHQALKEFPRIHLNSVIKPVSAHILQFVVEITAQFDWNLRRYGPRQHFWLFLEDPNDLIALYCLPIIIVPEDLYQSKMLDFYLPRPENINQLILKVVSDRWLHSESALTLKLSGIEYPKEARIFTSLPKDQPLVPTNSVTEPAWAQGYFKYSNLNGVQSVVFPVLYASDRNVLVGAPTGSGKTTLAELAIFRSLKIKPNCLCVYIAPLKAIVKERIHDWGERLKMLKPLELSGDNITDYRELAKSNLVVATPEKWDSVTRSWRIVGQNNSKQFIERVTCIIMDEVHLLGTDRGGVLEAIVSRFRSYFPQVRLIGLSTALANALDVAEWLGAPKSTHVFGFSPEVRPVPVTVKFEGFPGRHYCPRMASMNKPLYQWIQKEISPKDENKDDVAPVLIFVSSRRQTRLTAEALISLSVQHGTQFQTRFTGIEQESVLLSLEDEALKLSIPFGITLHNAGLSEADRRLSEQLFLERKIQVMIATSTVAWGVNFPARVVIVKGCEYFDAKRQHYTPYAITDVMQMIGRAGRPQFDTSATAILLVEEERKEFYKQFLYDPFPVESCFGSNLSILADMINAELWQNPCDYGELLGFLKSTFLHIRLQTNNQFYGGKTLNFFLDEALQNLEKSKCITLADGKYRLQDNGQVAAKYYLSHKSILHWWTVCSSSDSVLHLLRLLSLTPEFAEFSFRHNEDLETKELLQKILKQSKKQSFPEDFANSQYVVNQMTGDVHDKVFSLLLAWITAVDVELIDWRIDQAAVLDQVGRVLSGLIAFLINQRYLLSLKNAIILKSYLSEYSDSHLSPKFSCRVDTKTASLHVKNEAGDFSFWLLFYFRTEGENESENVLVEAIRGVSHAKIPPKATHCLVISETVRGKQVVIPLM